MHAEAVTPAPSSAGTRPRSFAAVRRLIAEDIRNNNGWHTPGARAMAVYRLGSWLLEMKPGLLRKVVLRLHTSMQRYVRNAYGIELSRDATIGRGVVIGHQSGIVIHQFATIGDDCLIRQGVTMGITMRAGAALPENGPTLGDRVDIGAGAVIMGAVKIGDDVRIFPNAVVLTNVASRSTVMAPTSRIISMASAPEAITE